jgi:hypothetical protein
MATLNTSSNGPNITRSYQNVVNAPPPSGLQASSPTYGQWAVFTVAAPLVSAFQQDGGKESVLKVQSTGGTWNRRSALSIAFACSAAREHTAVESSAAMARCQPKLGSRHMTKRSTTQKKDITETRC